MRRAMHFFMYNIFCLLLPVLAHASEAQYVTEREDAPAFVMGALGDSITTAVNASGWGAMVEESWSTGTSQSGAVNSHYRRLMGQMSRAIERHNFAQGGATSAGLELQVNKLLTVKPNYVTVLIGANDVCSWHDNYQEKIATYLKRMSGQIQRLVAAQPEVKILLSPIPNLYRVWEVGRQHSCQWFWDATNICSDVFHSSRTDAQRQDFVALVHQVNAGLQSIAERYPDHIKFDASLVDLPIAWNHISSSDCFHPSLAGQNLIAEKTWKSGWFVY